ncbi:replication initiation factor domain-containing protein [Kamptonema animale CS-326]|jgi:hypothetical protein|uniref:replication initiation factor domain-containing protein n=1 Tax=Kamptonema animale TaxID=92934 RepID=UPI00232CB2B3|nr:replication initiation factor domain-containing protein [Kamptonema animale]MDB9510466.1 replication initiation factor domain-containing protein [Kamptonema animale CS-326]
MPLERTLKIDWLRFQFSSNTGSMVIDELLEIINLPFDLVEGGSVAINKHWPHVWEFQGSKIGYIDFGEDCSYNHDLIYRFFVDLSGSVLSLIGIEKAIELIFVGQCEQDFKANRIDIALDFPIHPSGERLHLRPWEFYLASGKLFTRTFKRFSSINNNSGSTSGSTVYIGSRSSDSFVRLYGKGDFDRWEVEIKRGKSQIVMDDLVKFNTNDRAKLLEYLHSLVIGSISIDCQWIRDYTSNFKPVVIKLAPIELDIERSNRFFKRHAPTLASIHSYLGEEKFGIWLERILYSGRNRMKRRHLRMVYVAQYLGVVLTFLAAFLPVDVLAIAPVCPANSSNLVPASLAQKFPVDIVMPNDEEKTHFQALGDGCFQINAGVGWEPICTPGMIIRVIQPFIVIGVGLKFILND